MARRACRTRLPGGNPLGKPAGDGGGIETLRALDEHDAWDAAHAAERLFEGLGAVAVEADVAGRPPRVGTMVGFFFADAPVHGWGDGSLRRRPLPAFLHGAMLERGVYLPPSQFEAWFLSSAHGDTEIDATVTAAADAFASLR